MPYNVRSHHYYTLFSIFIQKRGSPDIFFILNTGMETRFVLLDIDGTIFSGSNPIPGASETISYLQENGIGYRFISNGTRRARKTILDKLRQLNLPVSEEQIITPATAAVTYLKEHGYHSCMLLTTDDLRQDFIEGGLTISDDAPVIVVGDAGDSFTYSSINQAFRKVLNGAHLLALEKDRYWKDGDHLSLGAGAFVAGIEYASGVSAVLMGKPSPDFFRIAMDHLGAEPGVTMMVGDDITSDIGGAKKSGLISVLVMTGKFRQDILENSQIKPDLIIPSIASLPGLIDPA